MHNLDAQKRSRATNGLDQQILRSIKLFYMNQKKEKNPLLKPWANLKIVPVSISAMNTTRVPLIRRMSYIRSPTTAINEKQS